MRILIGGDTWPTDSNRHIFECGNMESIVDAALLGILASADYRIFNLEGPLTDTASPIRKCGANLISSTASVKGLKRLGADFVTLANNHIMDQGEQGLFSTMRLLQDVEIFYGGGGNDAEEAAEARVINMGGHKVGIYCCAEHEFSIAGKHQAGANPFDPLESPDHIARLKENSDYVICLYHGGKEHYRYPSPGLRKSCRKMVEKGADLVVCQHSHCIGCKEEFMKGTIVYGQGNFLFDNTNNEFWQTSLLLSVDLDGGGINYIPLRKNGNGVRVAVGQDAEEIMEGFEKRSRDILSDEFVEREYERFADRMIAGYVMTSSEVSRSFLFRAVNKVLGNRLRTCVANRKIKRYGTAILNGYECEAHRELIIKGLRNKL